VRQRLGDGRTRELVLTYTTFETESGPFTLLTGVSFDNRAWQYTYGGTRLHLEEAIPPLGPRWTFDFDDDNVTLGVGLPQGGLVEYAFDVAGGTPSQPRWGVARRSTWDGAIERGRWTFSVDPLSPTSSDFDRVIDGPGAVRHRYRYETGPTLGGTWTLRSREVWDMAANTRLEGEARLYTASLLSSFSGAVLNLLTSVTLTRDDHSYHTGLVYRTSAERFADYGRPWRIEKSGDAGTRVRERAFKYDFAGYMIDKVETETLTASGDTYTRSWDYDTTTGFVNSATRYGITTRYEPNTATGTIATALDAHNHETTFTYDWGVLQNVSTELYPNMITRTID
jgi:hypothetical protein